MPTFPQLDALRAAVMTDQQFRAFLDLMMCSDPWPVPDLGQGDGQSALAAWADAESVRRGFDGWIEAYHRHQAPVAVGAASGDEWRLSRGDICGLCGDPGADKVPHPHYWPGELRPDTEYVHRDCEDAEQSRAHSCLTDAQRERFLRDVMRVLP